MKTIPETWDILTPAARFWSPDSETGRFPGRLTSCVLTLAIAQITLPNTRQALVPPNPKELDRATWTPCCRAVCGA